MKSLAATLLLLTPTVWALPAVTKISEKDFTGSGYIHVLNTSNVNTANPSTDAIGCLDENGKLTVSDCAVFTRLNTYPYTLSSSVGNCTFRDPSEPQNLDSAYGKIDYAWVCKADHVADVSDELYTINGFPYVFLCVGDVGCYYDTKAAPEESDYQQVWRYYWGSQQLGITPGHLQTAFLWEKVNSTGS